MMRLVLAAVLLTAACGGTEAEAAAVAAPLDTAAFVGRWNAPETTFADGTVRPGAHRTDITSAAGVLHISDVCTPTDPPYLVGRGPSATPTSVSTFDVQPFACPVLQFTECSARVLSWFGLPNNRITTVTGGHGSLSADGKLTITLTGTRTTCGAPEPFTVTFVGIR